jgi:hypothetical protein
MMTAGIQHGWFYDYDSDLDKKELLRRYAVSAFPPGQHFVYSNFSYGILGEVIEGASGQPFAEFVWSELLRPLNMTSSGFGHRGLDLACGYHAGEVIPPHTFEPQAGGGFYSSAHDLALFGLHQSQSAQSLLVSELLQDMSASGRNGRAKVRYSSGWGVLDTRAGTRVLISNGSVLGGSGTLVLLPDENIAVACLTNAATQAMDELGFALADVFSTGLLSDLESAIEEIEAAETLLPFHADEAEIGLWVGTVATPLGELLARMEVSSDNQIQIGFDQGSKVPVESLGIERGFLSGEASLGISLPETRDRPAKVTLELLRVDPDKLIGTVRVESTGELPRFGLPLQMTLSRTR